MEGWIKLHRKLLESEMWLTKPCSWNKVWIYILSKVNHEDNKFFKRGENFFNLTQEIKHIGCDVSYDNIREFLRYAKSTTMITTRKTTRGIVIKVNKYAIYQSKDETKTTTETTSPTTIKPQQNHNDKQECKNERNISKDISGKPDKDFSSKEYIKYLIGSPQRHVHIIGLFFSYKEMEFETKGQIQAQMKQHFKPARDLANYQDDRILETFSVVDKESNCDKKFAWNLNTILKKIQYIN